MGIIRASNEMPFIFTPPFFENTIRIDSPRSVRPEAPGAFTL